MELEAQAAKKAYISLMIETLRKKTVILEELMQLTKQQEDMIAVDEITEEKFLQLVSQKEEQLNKLAQIDEGFDKLFQSVKEELKANKEKYIPEIESLKKLIAGITDLSVKLQAMESRNKTKMELYFSNQRKKIRRSVLSTKTAANYYKTMAQQHEEQSFFYDKKN